MTFAIYLTGSWVLIAASSAFSVLVGTESLLWGFPAGVSLLGAWTLIRGAKSA